jgi:hypothetical protein
VIHVLRTIRPLITLVVNVGIHVNVRRSTQPPRSVQPPSPEPNEPENDDPPVWTLRQLADETGVPEFLVARVARDLGFTDLVFGADEVAAIIAVLRGGPPPRVA